jgi:pimeloyl-ACP methyl ester carboxylesterase
MLQREAAVARASFPRALAWPAAGLIATPGAALLCTCLIWGLSWWSAVLALGLLGLALALVGFHHAAGARRRCRRVALVLLLGPPVLRACLVTDSDAVALAALPGGKSAGLLARLWPESDGALLAAGLLGLSGRLNDDDGPRFHQIMQQVYARSMPPATRVPTPAIATYLGLQSPRGFDTLLIPPGWKEPHAALIFLHGYAGNFYVYCREVAYAAQQAELLTVCPSVSARGDWWSAAGEQTFVATVNELRRRGMRRIYLGGLSNGASGASVIAQRHQRELAGLVLVSGGRAHTPRLPTLVIQGASDRMMPAASARAAARASRAKYRELPGGHMVFFTQHERVRAEIAQFLSTLEGMTAEP